MPKITTSAGPTGKGAPAAATTFAREDGVEVPVLPLCYSAGAVSGYVWTTDANGNGSWQAVGSESGGTVTSVTATDTSIVVSGTDTIAPTIATGTLDVIATQHPPAAAWSNNSEKITSLANGSSAQDAAAFGQIPTSASSIGGLLASNNLDDVGTASTAFGNISPMTTSGDIIYGGASGAGTRLAGTTSATKHFLTQTGSGSASAAPAWGTIASGDVPTLNQNTTGTAGNLTSGATLPGYLAPAVVTLSFVSSGTTTVNAASGNAFALTLTDSTSTLGAPSNPVNGQVIRIRMIQDSSGSRTIAYNSAYDFGAAGAPTLSTAANKIDILGFEYVSSISKWCYLGSGLGF